MLIGNYYFLTYLGHIIANIEVPGFGLISKTKFACIMLVVPAGKYNIKVLILLGTNILEEMMTQTAEGNGVSFLVSGVQVHGH